MVHVAIVKVNCASRHIYARAAALGLGAVHCINGDGPRYRARKQRNSAGQQQHDSPWDYLSTVHSIDSNIV